nr:proteasome subunit beta type-4 [Ipomoea batatas]
MADSTTPAQSSLLGSQSDSQRTLYPYVTGTSVVGIKYKDGVLLVADMGGSYGSTLRYKSVERLKPVGKHSIVGASGEISDFQEILRYLDELILYDNMWDDGNSLGPKEVHNYLTRVMYNRRNKFNPLWNSLILGGVKNGQKYLGTVNMIGVHYEDNHVATGFGNHLARPILREEWNENLSFEEGVKLLEKCMRVLLYRDRSAVNKIQIVKITEEGATSFPPYSLKTYWGFSAFENPTSGAEGSCLTTAFHCLAHETHHSHKKHKVALFVFGDSLFDPGNNNYINTTTNFQANFPPYGESYFKHPTGRFSNGRLMPDFIAQFAKLPLIPAYFRTDHRRFINGVNFASAGAGCLVETFSGFFTRLIPTRSGAGPEMSLVRIEPQVIDLKTQLGYFKKVAQQLKKNLGDKESKTLISNAVYTFSIGNNDLGFRFSTNSTIFNSYTRQEYVEMVIGSTPSARAFKLQQKNNSGYVKELHNLAKMHNKALPKKLNKLEKTLQGFKYSYFDFLRFTTNAIHNPSKYGFKETKTACCGSGPFRGLGSCGGKRGELKEYELCKNVGDYLFFDNGHPTEKSNLMSARLLWNGDHNLVQPDNVKSFFEFV